MLKGVPQTHSPGGYYFMRIFLIHVFFFSNYLCPGNLSCFEAFSVQHVLPSDPLPPTTTKSSEWGVLCVQCKQASAQTAVKQGWEVSGVRGTSPP